MQPAFGGGCEAAFLDHGYEITQVPQLHRRSMPERYAASLQSLFQERHERPRVAAVEALEGPNRGDDRRQTWTSETSVFARWHITCGNRKAGRKTKLTGTGRQR